MAQTILPQELVELIIDEVGNESDRTCRVAALTACSLTSWSFLTPARKNIFKMIYLVEDAGNEDPKDQKNRSRLERFANLVLHDPCKAYPGQPHLPQHVKRLWVTLSGERVELNTEQPADTKPRSPSIVSHTLGSVPKVLDFTLSLSSAWPFVDDLTKEALEVFCTSQPIVKLRLSGIKSFPMAIIAHCSHLRSLSVNDFRTPDWHSPLRTPPVNSCSSTSPSLAHTPSFPPLLDHLLFESQWYPGIMADLTTSATPPRLNAILQLPSLRVLDIAAVNNEEEWTFIKALPSLSHLCIRHNHKWTSRKFSPESLDSGELTHLKVFELRCYFGKKALDAGFIPLSRWKTFDPKEPSMTPSSIETLIIHGHWTDLTRQKEARNFWPRSGWKGLDGVLSSDRFPNLSALQLKLVFGYAKDETVPRESAPLVAKELHQLVQEKLKHLLPSISRTPSVQVDIDIEVHGNDASVRRAIELEVQNRRAFIATGVPR